MNGNKYKNDQTARINRILFAKHIYHGSEVNLLQRVKITEEYQLNGCTNEVKDIYFFSCKSIHSPNQTGEAELASKDVIRLEADVIYV